MEESVRLTPRAGKTEWAHALAGGLSVRGAEGSVARSDSVPETVIIGKTNKRINIKYGLDIHYYCCAVAGSGVALL